MRSMVHNIADHIGTCITEYDSDDGQLLVNDGGL